MLLSVYYFLLFEKEIVVNIVILYGNLTKDPILRYIDRGPNKVAVANFTIATHRHFKKSSGEKGKETTFVDAEVWDSAAETIAKFVHKGDPLLIERGSFRNDNYEKDGVMQYKTKVRVEKFQLMPRKESNGEYSAKEESTPEPVAESTTESVTASVAKEVDGNEIPF